MYHFVSFQTSLLYQLTLKCWHIPMPVSACIRIVLIFV